MTPTERPTSVDFSSHLNQPFKLEVGTLPPILLQLRAVRNLQGAEESHYVKSNEFVVFFNGPLRPLLPRQVYCLEHPILGKIKLLFVPVGPSGSSMQYQATPVA